MRGGCGLTRAYLRLERARKTLRESTTAGTRPRHTHFLGSGILAPAPSEGTPRTAASNAALPLPASWMASASHARRTI